MRRNQIDESNKIILISECEKMILEILDNLKLDLKS
jgi:hypothetical protein